MTQAERVAPPCPPGSRAGRVVPALWSAAPVTPRAQPGHSRTCDSGSKAPEEQGGSRASALQVVLLERLYEGGPADARLALQLHI